jgi:citrate lyase subunit beta/citryl-CoA lyase
MPIETILRSVLFVPGDDSEKLAKAKQLPSDALAIDWEDGVALPNRHKARVQAIEFTQQRDTLPQAILIRMNPVFSPEFSQDYSAIQQCEVDGIILSKCRFAGDVHTVADLLDKMVAFRECRIYPLIESPAALLNAFSIATASDRVTALVFGAEDFSAEMGIVRSQTEIELLYARCSIVTSARAAGRDALDSPCLHIRNPERVREAGRHARNLGFTGKLAIHPSQLEILNEVFSSSDEELEGARRIIAAASPETGAFSLEGMMVDEPILKRARQVLSRSSRPQKPAH